VTYIDSNNAWTAGWGWYEGSVIYFSSDKGLTWTCQIESDSLNDVFFINSATGWAVGNNGTILHTKNGGVPVELISFTATSNTNEVILNWSTATETNNRGFEIQRRTIGSEFFTIGFVNGYGTTTDQHNYSYTDKNLNNGKYYYRLKQFDYNGSYEYSDVLEIDRIGVDSYILEQNFPNPFNPSTKIKYSVPQSSNVVIKVFDILGNEITTLVNDEKPAGTFEVTWYAEQLPSGVYFYQLKTGYYVDTKKMILIK
jgi:hypothetical protein